MARRTSSSDDSTEQETSETPTARTADTGDSSTEDQPAVDEGMRHETHGELPSERPASNF